MSQISLVRSAVQRALWLSAAAGALPLSALAQQAPTQLEEVVVTGTILHRADSETPSPVTVLTADTLEKRGISTISEALQRIPSNNAGTLQQGWNTGSNFAAGATAPALRGLTVQSTLSVMDGLRMAPYPLSDDGQRNFVDLSSLPSAIIERIEVLRDGASSTYGADAIAGVVNVITRKEIQGVHLGGSGAMSQAGGGGEQRADLTWGMGSLENQDFNFYVSAEYQKQDALYARDRGYPFNSGDLSRICGPTGSCMRNRNPNGVTAESGLFNSLTSIPGVALIRPVTTAGATNGSGRYQYVNPAAGCREWKTNTITAAQSAIAPLSICEWDARNAYQMVLPDSERSSASMRFTANLGESSQFYAMANYSRLNTLATSTPLGFNGLPTPPIPQNLASYNVILPVFVCSSGVGTPNGTNTGCNATNGQLNPSNPFAAQGQTAHVLLRSPFPTTDETNARSIRAVLGIDGAFLGDWRYSASFSSSEVGLQRTQSNYLIPQRIMDVVARGTFDFANPLATPREVWDYIAPDNVTYSPSRLWQVQGTIGTDLLSLPGGKLQAALGFSYRDESISAPSANPANDSAPYTRYFSINAVGTSGSRAVTSGFFELRAPVIDKLELDASGRYDKYSTGQSSFSPKLGFKFSPIEQLAVRGTWSTGFRVPSFNEAFGLPTTGYQTRQVDCTTFSAYCASHGNNTYASGSYSLGVTQTGNPELDPERSRSFTAGLIVEPIRDLSFTLDYWNIQVNGLITGVASTAEAEAQYYGNNGTVSIPGITVIPGVPDPAFPNALPALGFIQKSYDNQDRQSVSGIDFGSSYRHAFGDSLAWSSTLDVSYLQRYELETEDGQVLRYDGTLSPCNITSCSGAPKWRASWQNTVQVGKADVSLTGYYTSGYDTASIDFGGVAGDCEASIGASTQAYVDGTPVMCSSKPTWNADLTVRYAFDEKLTAYADVLNVLDTKAPFDPAAAYQIFMFNPAWAGPNILGRYFRVGVKLDL